MRRSVIALAGVAVAAMAAAPITAEAHWRHPHRIWHRGWHHAWPVGPSYYPTYGFIDDDPHSLVCVWHREWDVYWHRDCF
jgi:hypothetical protein